MQEACKKAELGVYGDNYQLEVEFNTLLSSLINHHIDGNEIESNLIKIIAKINANKPNPNNIN